MLLGIGLMEIVTESDFACGQEAVGFVKELQAVLQSLDTCNGHFEGISSCFLAIILHDCYNTNIMT